MKSSPFLLTLLSCVATEATTNSHRRNRSFITKRSSSSYPIITIPRGGSDDSSSSSAPDISSLLASMGGMPGMPDMSQPPSAEQIQQSMEQFTSLLSSPQFKDIMNDPTKLAESLETMRISLLGALNEMEKGDNPMMIMMMEQMKSQVAQAFPGGWDGIKELISDKDKWAEMMGGLVEVLKSLGEEDLNNIMSQMAGAAGMGGMGGMGGMPGMGGMGGMGGMPGMGMGGNTLGDALGGDTAGTLAGLDDLSEGED